MKITSSIPLRVFALCLLVATSCSKEPIVLPESNDPVFMVSGTIGGESFDLIAGDNNAFMHTSTEIESGVRVFTGRLSDGETYIEMGIYDGNIDKPNHIPELDLSSVVLNFAKKAQDPLLVLRKSDLDQYQNMASVDWYVNGSFAGTNEAFIMNPGKYNVCAFVHFAAGDSEELCDEIIIGYSRSANCTITPTVQQGVLTSSISSVGSNVESVEWFVDGVSVGTNPNLSTNISQESHLLTAKVSFENGAYRTKSCRINGLYPTRYISDFSLFELYSGSNFQDQDYNIKLEMRKDGHVYKTVRANNDSSTLTLLGIEYYGKNTENKDVYKATVAIDAIVMDLVSEKLIPIHFTAVVGIEVP